MANLDHHFFLCEIGGRWGGGGGGGGAVLQTWAYLEEYGKIIFIIKNFGTGVIFQVAPLNRWSFYVMIWQEAQNME